MTNEHYFVVRGTIDIDGQVKFVIDHDTAAAIMPEGSVWNTEEVCWHHVREELEADDVRIGQALTDLITPAPIATVRHLHVIIDPEQHEETE